MTKKYVPFTPSSTMVEWLKADTEDEAWEKLMIDAAHMPYVNKEAFIERGYTVELINFTDEQENEDENN